MKKISTYCQIAVFLLFIGGFFVLNIFTADTSFSEQENRYLQQKPSFSFEDLIDGSYISAFEKYKTDQFALRDTWITLKAASELALGKSENKGVYLVESDLGDTLIETFTAPPTEAGASKVDYINKLVENLDIPVYFGLIPAKAGIWWDLLPENAPNDSEFDFINGTYAQSNAINLDIFSSLNEHKDEYIYYRTDHHWTSLGAYYAYETIMEALGYEANDLNSYDIERASDEFYGTTWSSSGFSWVAPDSIDYYVADSGFEILNYSSGVAEEGTLYDRTYLEKKDKYSSFFGGNTPLLQIVTESENDESILIIRDSYTDSLTPFLLEDFAEVHVMDLRYYRASIVSYVEENDIDVVIVLYNTANYITDTNLFLLGR